MDQLTIAIGTVLGTIVVAVISAYVTYYFTRKMQLEAEWRKDKLVYYQRFIDSISATTSGLEGMDESLRKFSHTFNSVSLIAPQCVADIAYSVYGDIRVIVKMAVSDETKLREYLPEMNDRLQKLVLAMRKDLQIMPRDNPNTFQYSLQGPITVRSTEVKS
ncbi:MAG: hypothetical protein AAB305_04265 [Candidatus Zixiibacteriota bacterium]